MAPQTEAPPILPMPEMHQRRTDRWYGPIVAFWDWIDRRNIDLHAVLVFTLWMTGKVMEWAMTFADSHPDMDGTKMAAIIASVLLPWGTVQGAMMGFWSNARKGTDIPAR